LAGKVPHDEYQQMKKGFVAVLAGLAGAAMVVAAINFSFLHWIVDVPGWLVRQFIPINFHEGEGAFGFFLSIFLSWLLSTITVWFLFRGIRRVLR
jgi:hypothetical protein